MFYFVGIFLKIIYNRNGGFMKKKIVTTLLCILLIIPLFFVGSVVYQHYKTRDGICIVGYHGVVSDKEKKEKYADNRYFLSESQFKRQMKYLYEHHYQTLSMQDIDDYYQGKINIGKKTIALTFDDGYKNFNTVVKPILEEYGFNGTCFVIGKHLTDQNNKMLKTNDIVNSDKIHYYSHSYNLHRTSSGFDRKIIQDLSLEEIQEDFDINPLDSTYFAFPYGRSRDDIEPILKASGVKLAFSYNQFRHMTRNDDPYYLPRYMIVDIMPDIYFQWIIE